MTSSQQRAAWALMALKMAVTRLERQSDGTPPINSLSDMAGADSAVGAIIHFAMNPGEYSTFEHLGDERIEELLSLLSDVASMKPSGAFDQEMGMFPTDEEHRVRLRDAVRAWVKAR